jgi:hypothetical protein
VRHLWFFAVITVSALSCPQGSFGIDVYLARIAYIDESGDAHSINVTAALWDALGKQDIAPPFRIHRAAQNQTPATLMEALRLSQFQKYDYLIYGFVLKTPENLAAELKILDREKGMVIQTFYASDTHDHFDRMVNDIAEKVGYYYRDELGFRYSGYDEEPVRNLWRFEGSAGYWMPTSDGWSSSLMGIAVLQFGAGYTPLSPFTVYHGKPTYIVVSANIEYAFGLSRPSRESAFFHSMLVRLGPALEFQMTNRQRFGFGTGLSYRLDILSKTRKYDNSLGMITGTPGFYTSVLHSIKYNDSFEIGWMVLLDVSWYQQALWSLSPRLRLVYHRDKRNI